MTFTFAERLSSVGGAAVTKGTATVSGGNIDPNDPHRYVVRLNGVADRQYLKVTLSDVVDVAGNRLGLISQQVGLLIGDTNGDNDVNAGDVTVTRNMIGQELTASN